MPELPEVEVLVRHLAPIVRGRKILDVQVYRAKTVAPTSPSEFARILRGTRFEEVSRRGKYLVFGIRAAQRSGPSALIGHLGMTGRMYLLDADVALPKHAAVVFYLGRENFVFEDTRYFGRLNFDARPFQRLGPEPLEVEFTVESLGQALARSTQPVKVKLLDQSVVAGIGNIYASEVLFRARVSPCTSACRLKADRVAHLRKAIRETLAEAIECGSTVPLDFSGYGDREGHFYFGRAPRAPDFYEKRLRVYDRAGEPCARCGCTIRRIILASRSTYYCPHCQRT